MAQSGSHRTIEGVKTSSTYIFNSFKKKFDQLRSSYQDVNKLLRFGVDYDAAKKTAVEFFGSDSVKYIAIDGTTAYDEELDLLVFYVGAFTYKGLVRFTSDNSTADEPEPVEDTGVSAAIPLSEEDAASVFGQSTQAGIEVDVERLPSSIMHLAEYYLAYKAIESDKDVKIILLDRTLAGDMGHLVWSTKEVIDEHASILEGMDTPYGKVSNFDLQLARMLLANQSAGIPPARSQFIEYAALLKLMDESQLSIPQLLGRLRINPAYGPKLQKEFGRLENDFHIFEQVFNFKLKKEVHDYWNRVMHAAKSTAEHVFNTDKGHPLRISKEGHEEWIKADDLDFITLLLIYYLARESWNRNILPIGITKDTSAAELIKTVVPLLRSSRLLQISLPNFDSDKMLLQTNSVINSEHVPTPWHSIDIDAAFRTMAPGDDASLPKGEAKVRGAYKNIISQERTFVKCYMQLWSSSNNPSVRSHVFTFDRPVYSRYDHWNELTLHHFDNKIDNKIHPVLHLSNESRMTNLCIAILSSMAGDVIPEALGHNYPLFLADKKAKAVLEENRNAYLAALALEMRKSDLDQQVLFSTSFRDYRSKIESERRK
ncbi:MAG: hypothetical protein QXV32_00030 [Conexivisphaerales archaeon]